jgi:hypothetical protein
VEEVAKRKIPATAGNRIPVSIPWTNHYTHRAIPTPFLILYLRFLFMQFGSKTAEPGEGYWMCFDFVCVCEAERLGKM